jgi:hypothetical protein
VEGLLEKSVGVSDHPPIPFYLGDVGCLRTRVYESCCLALQSFGSRSDSAKWEGHPYPESRTVSCLGSGEFILFAFYGTVFSTVQQELQEYCII